MEVTYIYCLYGPKIYLEGLQKVIYQWTELTIEYVSKENMHLIVIDCSHY